MSSSGLKSTNFSVKHLSLLIFISFQFCTKPAIAYTHCWAIVLFFVRLSALAKAYSFAIFGLCIGWCGLQMCMAFSVGFSITILIRSASVLSSNVLLHLQFQSVFFRALGKNSSFGFFRVGFRFGKKPNVLFVRLAFCMLPNNRVCL
ncbi:hypothetical protein DSECCO2_512310 [anaerobic digester metagenome]